MYCTRARSFAAPLIVAVIAFGASGCGSKVVFEGQSALPIIGQITAPPPPKPKPVINAPVMRVVLHDKNIEITEKIQFELNKATILPESFGLLDEVAGVIKDHPDIKKLAIEGHASSDGNKQQNLLLSDARAKSVMEYLVTKGGVEKNRLSAEGFGDKKPIADNNTEEGRIKNRRVEFNIVERGPGKTGGDKAADPKAMPTGKPGVTK